jgi:hypothetical protein
VMAQELPPDVLDRWHYKVQRTSDDIPSESPQ